MHMMPLIAGLFPQKSHYLGLFCEKWHLKIRHPMGLRHPATLPSAIGCTFVVLSFSFFPLSLSLSCARSLATPAGVLGRLKHTIREIPKSQFATKLNTQHHWRSDSCEIFHSTGVLGRRLHTFRGSGGWDIVSIWHSSHRLGHEWGGYEKSGGPRVVPRCGACHALRHGGEEQRHQRPQKQNRRDPGAVRV